MSIETEDIAGEDVLFERRGPLLLITLPIHGDTAAAILSAATWALMAWTFVPTASLYRLGPLRGLALPVAGVLYTCMTVDSARLHWLGRGATWKGRSGAGRTDAARRGGDRA